MMLQLQACSVQGVPHVQIPGGAKLPSVGLWHLAVWMDPPLKATTGRARKGQGALNSSCQKGWYGDESCQAKDQDGSERSSCQLQPTAKSLGEHGATASLSGIFLLTLQPKILGCQLPPTLITTPGLTLKPVLYCRECPKPNSQIKMHSMTSGLLTCPC